MLNTYLKTLVNSAEINYLTHLTSEVSKLNLDVKSFLDIGCFTGTNTVMLAKACNAEKVYGMDFNKEALLEAKEKGIISVYQDISEKDWLQPEDTYDFVYSNQTIEHLYSVDNFITNIKKILKPGGYALISTENLAGWHNVFSLFFGFQPFSYTNLCTKKWSIGNPFSVIDDGWSDPLMVHRALFTHYSLRQFLQLYDFEIIKPISSGYYPFPNGTIGNFLASVDPRHAVYIAFVVRNKK